MSRIAATRGARLVSQFLLLGAIVAAALAAVSFATDGFRTHLFGLPISVRSANRAAWAAILLAATAILIDARFTRRIEAALARAPRLALPFCAVLAASAVLAVGLVWGTRSVGTADVYGYVSQAQLWREGNLKLTQPLAEVAPWPRAIWTLSPLGYRPWDEQTIVPAYPPGLPLLLALAETLFGSDARFLVVPFCGAALVLLTYGLGARTIGRPAGLIAAVGLAASPTVLMMTCWLLGDLPAAAFWTGALILALKPGHGHALASGILSGVAVLIRPNLVGLAPILAAATFTGQTATGARKWVPPALFVAGCAPAMVWIAVLFNDLYGSPLLSGYGEAEYLFASSHVPVNLRQFSEWLTETQGPMVVGLLSLPFLWSQDSPTRTRRTILLAVAGATLLSYLAYVPFDEWWFLRFLLPAFPSLFILAAYAIRQAARLWETRAAASLGLSALLVMYGATEALDRNALGIGVREDRYADVGDFINRHLPGNAIFLAQQHSGAIRYYTGRTTIRYDLLDPQWLDRTVDWLEGHGYEPYFLLDREELAPARDRFRTQRSAQALQVEVAPGSCLHPIVLLPITAESPARAPSRIPIRRNGCSQGTAPE